METEFDFFSMKAKTDQKWMKFLNQSKKPLSKAEKEAFLNKINKQFKQSKMSFNGSSVLNKKELEKRLEKINTIRVATGAQSTSEVETKARESLPK